VPVSPLLEHALLRPRRNVRSRHEEHGPVITLSVDQHFLRRQVQVIRRLVEHEEVRRFSSILAITSPFLAARQRADLPRRPARKLKSAEQVPEHTDRFVGEVRSICRQIVESGLSTRVPLGEVTHLQLAPRRIAPRLASAHRRPFSAASFCRRRCGP
jgi:hypothetical protein